MYEYICVESGLENTCKDHHREIIERHSAEGWRLVAVIPTRTGGYGQLVAYDLVFEKERPESKKTAH